MTSKQRMAARLGAVLVAVLAAGAPSPADAGNGKGKGNTGKHTGGILPTSVSIVSTDFSMTTLNADALQAATTAAAATGRGVVVAVLDAGFDLRDPVTGPNLVEGFDAIDLDSDAHDPGNGVDDDGDGIVDGGVGHGTFVTSRILAAAADTAIVPIRVRDDEGRGTNDHLVAGLEFAVSAGADVVNLSVERAATMDDGLSAVLRHLRDRGITVVVAAGNDGVEAVPKLARVPDALCVGAVDASDRVASFSNYLTYESTAPRLVFALGVDVHGPLGHGAYGTWSGTSFAAGTVSGAAALVRELHPDWSVAAVSAAVASSVTPVRMHDGEVLEHSGRVDLATLVTR